MRKSEGLTAAAVLVVVSLANSADGEPSVEPTSDASCHNACLEIGPAPSPPSPFIAPEGTIRLRTDRLADAELRYLVRLGREAHTIIVGRVLRIVSEPTAKCLSVEVRRVVRGDAVPEAMLQLHHPMCGTREQALLEALKSSEAEVEQIFFVGDEPGMVILNYASPLRSLDGVVEGTTFLMPEEGFALMWSTP